MGLQQLVNGGFERGHIGFADEGSRFVAGLVVEEQRGQGAAPLGIDGVNEMIIARGLRK